VDECGVAGIQILAALASKNKWQSFDAAMRAYDAFIHPIRHINWVPGEVLLARAYFAGEEARDFHAEEIYDRDFGVGAGIGCEGDACGLGDGIGINQK